VIPWSPPSVSPVIITPPLLEVPPLSLYLNDRPGRCTDNHRVVLPQVPGAEGGGPLVPVREPMAGGV
jgi:hypothetical protein